MPSRSFAAIDRGAAEAMHDCSFLNRRWQEYTGGQAIRQEDEMAFNKLTP